MVSEEEVSEKKQSSTNIEFIEFLEKCIKEETNKGSNMNETINIYGEEYQQCVDKAHEFEMSEEGEYYKSILCLKETGSTCPAREPTLRKHYNKLEPYISNSYDEVKEHWYNNLCVLPNGHSGRCSCSMKIFKSNPTTQKLEESIRHSIHTTPGNNDLVFKNRDSRLHPLAITNAQEKQIRSSWSNMKENKLSCAIPLKEKSTPFMLATAYLDYMVYTTSICDIDEHIDKESDHYKMCIDMLQLHKDDLIKYFGTYNRNIFNTDGYTVCAVQQRQLRVSDMADPIRDNRTDIRPTDIQMGHVKSRSDNCFTVYGKNIVMMSRRGNLIIGEHRFTEDDWLDELGMIQEAHRG